MRLLLATLVVTLPVWCASSPVIALVANAEGEAAVIAPNTWVEIKGSSLSMPNDTRIWQGSDFVNNQLPTSLDGVSVTVNGKSAFVYYISPSQIDILTPPDAMPAAVNVVVTTNAGVSNSFAVKPQPVSPSFFVFGGGPYVVATHSVSETAVTVAERGPGSIRHISPNTSSGPSVTRTLAAEPFPILTSTEPARIR